MGSKKWVCLCYALKECVYSARAIDHTSHGNRLVFFSSLDREKQEIL